MKVKLSKTTCVNCGNDDPKRMNIPKGKCKECGNKLWKRNYEDFYYADCWDVEQF